MSIILLIIFLLFSREKRESENLSINEIHFLENHVSLHVKKNSTVIVDYVFIAPTDKNTEDFFENLSYLHPAGMDQKIEILRGSTYQNMTAYTLSRYINFNGITSLNEDSLNFIDSNGIGIKFNIGKVSISTYDNALYDCLELENNTGFSSTLNEYEATYKATKALNISQVVIEDDSFTNLIDSFEIMINSQIVPNKDLIINEGDEFQVLIKFGEADLKKNYAFNPLIMFVIEDERFTLNTVPTLYNYVLEREQFEDVKSISCRDKN